jgi:hypothetical protein
MRCCILRHQWLSLIPFNLYTDCLDALNYIRRLIYNKIMVPAGNLILKAFKYTKDIFLKIW